MIIKGFLHLDIELMCNTHTTCNGRTGGSLAY